MQDGFYSLGMALCFHWDAIPTCIFKFDIVPKVSFLGGPLATLDFFFKHFTYTRPTYFETHLGWTVFWASQVKIH